MNPIRVFLILLLLFRDFVADTPDPEAMGNLGLGRGRLLLFNPHIGVR